MTTKSERLTRERDEARETAVRLGRMVDQQARLIERELTFDDAMTLFMTAIVNEAKDAPNCWEVKGRANGRQFVLAVQWADGKTPQELLAETMAERDTLRAVIDGRAAPPTSKETDALLATGGHWLHSPPGKPPRWWALDEDYRPRAWPTTGGEGR